MARTLTALACLASLCFWPASTAQVNLHAQYGVPEVFAETGALPKAEGLGDLRRGKGYDAGDRYATLGGERRLLRDPGAFVVSSVLPSEEGPLADRLAGVGGPLEGYVRQSIPGRGLMILRASNQAPEKGEADPQGRGAVLAELRGAGGVRAANPVFVDPESGLWLVPTAELVIRLRPGVEAREYFGESWARARRLAGTEDQYVLSLADGRAEAVLAEATRRSGEAAVAWAEPDFVTEQVHHLIPNDPLFGSQWHLRNSGQGGGAAGADVKAPEAWDRATGLGAVIAVLDVGTQTGHPDLASNMALNAGEIPGNGLDDDGNGYVDDVGGWDFYANNNNPDPKTAFDNHGTPVAGVAMARGDNGLGVAGAALAGGLLPIRIGEALDGSGSFFSSPSLMAQAVYYAAGRNANGVGRWRGADVINLSIGTSSTQVFSDALNWAATQGRNGKGCPVFVSSGNGAGAWFRFTLSGVPAGARTFRWEYAKDGSLAIGQDAVWLDRVGFPGGEQERFEGVGLPAGWVTGGAAGWTSVQDGVDNNHALTGWDGPNTRSLRSGAIGDGASSHVEVTKTVAAGALTFSVWVSSEPNFDFFNFYADGVRYFHFSWLPVVTTPVGYPASHPDTIAVGASTDFDFRSNYSQYGAGLDFLAPSNGGVTGIRTTDRTGSSGYNTAAGSAGDYDFGFGGTSSAAPLAAGVGALMLGVNPELTASQVRSVLRETADKVPGLAFVNGFHPEYGYGRINAMAAVNAVLTRIEGLAITDPIFEGESAQLGGTVVNPPNAPYVVAVNWGDGSVENVAMGAGAAVLSANHAYADDAPSGTAMDVYQVTASIGSASAQTAVTVHNRAPVVNAGADQNISAGAVFQAAGGFSDAGAADGFTATVDYGDGTGTQPLALAPGRVFQLAHAFLAEGVYTVTVTVADDDLGVGLDTVMVTVGPGQPTGVLFSDQFDRADNTNLGASWAELAGDLGIVSGRLASLGSGLNLAVAQGIGGADVSLQANVDVAGSGVRYGGLTARQTGSGFYWGAVINNNGAFVAGMYRYQGGGFTLLASAPLTGASGKLRFILTGSSLRLYFNEALVLSAVDNAFLGSGAFGVLGSGGSYDDFAAAASAAAAPFGDGFARADGTFVGDVWTELAGDFSLISGQAVSPAGQLSLMILNGASAVDSTQEAEVTPGTPGVGLAGLVARFSGGGFYWGTLIHSNGQYFAGIYRQQGAFALLGSAPVAAGTARLRFEAAGTSLRLFRDNVLVVSVVDSALSGAGGIGLLGLSGSFEDYSWLE